MTFGLNLHSDKDKIHFNSLNFKLTLLFQHLVGTSVLGMMCLLRNCKNCRCIGCGSILLCKFQSANVSLSGFFLTNT